MLTSCFKPPWQGAPCCTINLEGRAARELAQALTRHALPAWERAAAEAARRCLWLTGDAAWLVSLREGGDAAAIGIERTDGRVRGAVALDVRGAQVLLRPLHGCGIR